jgi:hypothetical protein
MFRVKVTVLQFAFLVGPGVGLDIALVTWNITPVMLDLDKLKLERGEKKITEVLDGTKR